MFNGLHKGTLFVAYSDNIYVNFPCITLLRRDVDFAVEIVDKDKNIVFDSRLELTILYNYLIDSIDPLVYDICKHKIYSINQYVSERFSIKPWLLNKVFAKCYLILHHYFAYLNIKTKNLVGSDVIDTLINAIGLQKPSEYSTENVNKVVSFLKSFPNSNSFIAPKVNIYEFYIALTLLKK
jgi:hypothetical protein